jgi:hypothetical protein
VKVRILFTAVVGMLLLAGCTVMVPGTAVPADSDGPLKPKPVATSAVEDLLAGPVEVSKVAGSGTTLVQQARATGMSDSTGISSRDCRSAWSPLQKASYDGSGWISVAGKILSDERDKETRPDNVITQAVVSFNDSDAADTFFSGVTKRWKACSDKSVVYTQDGGKQTNWSLGPVISGDDVIQISQTAEGGRGWGCQHVLGVRNNIAIEVLHCAEGPGEQARGVFDLIARNVGDR